MVCHRRRDGPVAVVTWTPPATSLASPNTPTCPGGRSSFLGHREVAVSRDRRSDVPERVVSIHDRDRRLVIALVYGGAARRHPPLERSVPAGWPPSACRSHNPPPKRDWDAKSVEAKPGTELNEAVG